MTQQTEHRFYAYADGAGRSHGHTIDARSFEEAAVGYTERYSPPVTDGDEIRIFVRDLEGGAEHCFLVHLDGGEVEPCG